MRSALPSRATAIRVIGLVVLSVPFGPASAQPLTLAEAEMLALENEPGVLAAESRSMAMAERSVAAGELPDPELRLGVQNLPTDTFNFSQEPMTQAQIGLRQQLPPKGSLDAARREFGARSDGFDYLALARRREVLMMMREAWLEAKYWESARDSLTESKRLFTDLTRTTRSLYAVGRKEQQDVVRAELELSRLDDQLLVAEERIRRARAALAQWVGAAADRPLPEDFPHWPTPPPPEELLVRLEAHPQLAALSAQVAAADARVAQAQARYRPGLAVDLGYGFRSGEEPDGDDRADFFGVMFTIDLPLLPDRRQDRALAAAHQDSVAADSDRLMLLRKLRRELGETYVSWEQLGQRIELYQQTIIQQAELQAMTALNAYQSETGDFDDVMRGYIGVLEARLERDRLLKEQGLAFAKLDFLGGISDA
jgi:outer membrane protein TolC